MFKKNKNGGTFFGKVANKVDVVISKISNRPTIAEMEKTDKEFYEMHDNMAAELKQYKKQYGELNDKSTNCPVKPTR